MFLGDRRTYLRSRCTAQTMEKETRHIILYERLDILPPESILVRLPLFAALSAFIRLHGHLMQLATPVCQPTTLPPLLPAADLPVRSQGSTAPAKAIFLLYFAARESWALNPLLFNLLGPQTNPSSRHSFLLITKPLSSLPSSFPHISTHTYSPYP